MITTDQTVTLTYNPSPDPIAVPDVTGKTQEEASQILTALGLVPQLEPVDDPQGRAKGMVIAQNPPATTPVEQGSTVILQVSAGPGDQVVSNVTGLDEAVARQQLEALGFKVLSQPEASDSVAAGKVIRTDPASQVTAAPGATVTMFVSTGAQPTEVPDVNGQTAAQALLTLQNAGFKGDPVEITVPFGDSRDGKVVGQSPAAGAMAAKGSKIQITIGKAAPAPATTTTTTTTTPPTTAPPTTAAPTTSAATTAPPTSATLP